MTDEGVEHDRQVQSAGAASRWCSAGRRRRSTVSSGSSKAASKDETRRPVGGRGHVQPADRRHLGQQGNIFVVRRLQQLARREVRQGRQLGEGDRHARQRARTSSTPPHGITSDAKGNIYVADRGNRRIQVYDPDLNPLSDHRRRGRAVERLHLTRARRSTCSAATATARSTSWI